MIIILFFSLLSSAMGQWSPEIRVTYDPALDATPKIAVDSEGNLHIVWWSSRNLFPYDEEIYYTRLDSNGNKLIEDKRITETMGNSTNPAIAIDSRDNVHLVWRDQPEIADYARIYYARLDNEGNILVPPHQVVDAFGIWFNWLYPGVALDSRNNLHIVWDEYRYFEGPEGTYTLHYTKLDSMGEVLIQDIRLTSYEERPFRFSVAMDQNDHLHIVWEQSYHPLLTWIIMYAKLDSNGQFLIEPIRITLLELESRDPRIIIDNNQNLHLFISVIDTIVQEYYTKLDNNGNTLIDEVKMINQKYSNYFLGAALDDIFFRYYRPKGTLIYSEFMNDRFPEQFEVFQNYPNPFNATTIINYRLPHGEPCFITLKVFGMLGEEIVVLLNKLIREPGEYSIIWDGKDRFGKEVSSGIYLYELTIQKLSGSFVFRKANKMILVR